MDSQNLSLIAGMVSSLIFASSHVPMLWRAYKTRDLSSYSWLSIVMINAGNLLHWLYVVSLPFGPVWILHIFYTIASVLLLVMYVRYVLDRSIRLSGWRLFELFYSPFNVRRFHQLNQHPNRRYSPCSG